MNQTPRELVRRKCRSTFTYLVIFLKWSFIAVVTGLVGGGVGALFHHSIELATGVRLANSWLIWLLPVGGLAIVLCYHLCHLKQNVGTNQVIHSVRSEETVPPAMAPLIFIGTVITHLLGGSAGREGAALQLGGSIGAQLGRLFRLDEKDMHLITLCGMSSVFSALFGTPLTAAFFAMEVISVGVIYYSGFVPCLVSALTAYGISLCLGTAPVRFALGAVPALTPLLTVQVVLLAALCALLSIVFCLSLSKGSRLAAKLLPNEYLRIFIGGCVLIALTYLAGTRDYNGAGMDVITRAIGGDARPEAFLLKLLFTAVTICVGFKGGEIVPTLFIGSTFGCIMGGLLGLPAGFGAAVGVVALLCGVVNCPVASVLLSIELFGAEGLVPFTLACGVSYMLSGYYGLYSSQKIVYSKLKAELVNRFVQ